MFVKKTQNNINHLETYIEELKKNLKIKQVSIQTFKSEQSIDLRVDGCITAFTHTSNEIKNEIEKVSEKTREMKNKQNSNTYVIAMRESHVLSLSKRLSELVKSFQTVQYNYKQSEKERLKEMFKIACPDATQEQLHEIEDPEKAEEILNNALSLSSTGSKNVLTEAKNRKDRIEKIVEKINDLVKLIAEIDKIVSSSNIETDRMVLNMEDAARNTVQARSELTAARSYQNRRNWYIRLFGGTFIVLMAICGLILWSLIKK